MLIVCPSCASQYTIEPGRVGATGRVVRCATCREPWFIAGSATQPVEERIEPTRHVSVERPAGRSSGAVRKPDVGPPRARAPIAAKAACVSLLALAAGIVALRGPVVGAVPQTASLFATLGLPVNLVGLSLERVRSQLSQGPTGRILTITADIANPTSHAVAIPRLALSIDREDGESLYEWTASAAEAALGPGQRTRFETKLASPPPEGRVVAMTFSTAAPSPQVASR